MIEILNKIESMVEKGLVASFTVSIEKVGEVSNTFISVETQKDVTVNIDTLNISKDANIEDIAKELKKHSTSRINNI